MPDIHLPIVALPLAVEGTRVLPCARVHLGTQDAPCLQRKVICPLDFRNLKGEHTLEIARAADQSSAQFEYSGRYGAAPTRPLPDATHRRSPSAFDESIRILQSATNEAQHHPAHALAFLIAAQQRCRSQRSPAAGRAARSRTDRESVRSAPRPEGCLRHPAKAFYVINTQNTTK